MYTTLLVVHSYFRWVVILLAVLALARAFGGWRTRRPWTPADDQAGRLFTIALDVQVTLGLLLYVAFSPITRAAFQDMGAAMRDSVLRFYSVEHIVGMLVAVALVHVGRAKSQRASQSPVRHRAALVYFGLGVLVVLISIPWPFVPAGRPLFW